MNLKKLLRKRTSKKHYVDVRSREEYFKLPLEQRSRKVWYYPFPVYKLPLGLPFNIKSIILKEDSEWDLLYKELKKEFPVQVFFRESIQDSGIFWFFKIKLMRLKEFYRKWIKRTLSPYNKTLIKTIPTREWQDKDTIIRNFLYACILDYVDGENCFKNIDWTSTEKHEKFAKELKELYDFIRITRPTLEKEIELELTKASNREEGLTYEQKYGSLDRLEQELEEQDTKNLTWIINNRKELCI